MTTPTSRKHRRAIWLAALLLVIVTAFVFWVPRRLAKLVVTTPNAGRTFTAENDPPLAVAQAAGASEQLRVLVPGPPPISLSVWVVEPRVPAQGTVLVLHGIGADKQMMMGLAEMVAAAGFRAIVPDLPGHGRSSGDWLTYGIKEATTMSALLDSFEHEGRLDGALGVLGISYGAATAITLAAADSRVQAVLAIAPFRSLHAVVRSYAAASVPYVGELLPDILIDTTLARAGTLADFNPEHANPEEAIAHTKAAVLLVHGDRDQHIPLEQSKSLLRAAGGRAQLVVVPFADHFSIGSDPTGIIESDGMAWLRTRLAKRDGNTTRNE